MSEEVDTITFVSVYREIHSYNLLEHEIDARKYIDGFDDFMFYVAMPYARPFIEMMYVTLHKSGIPDEDIKDKTVEIFNLMASFIDPKTIIHIKVKGDENL